MAFWVIVGVVVVVALIFLEGWRQERVLGKRSTGTNLMGAAMLEVQSLLEAERKVTVVQESLRNEDRVEGEHEQQDGETLEPPVEEERPD